MKGKRGKGDSALYVVILLVPHYNTIMPGVARIVIPGVPHHITQRGNQRQDIFFTSGYRLVYLKLLMEYSTRYGLKIFSTASRQILSI
jgi:hypothetical protein